VHIIITGSQSGRSRHLQLDGARLWLSAVALAVLLLVLAVGLGHWIVIAGARGGWPVVTEVVRHAAQEHVASQERFLRDNIDAMARQVGELQARLVQLESLQERVSGLAGAGAPSVPKAQPGRGGALLAARPLSLDELRAELAAAETTSSRQLDWLSRAEESLFEANLKRLAQPTARPVVGAPVGSPFGWRIDPFTGSQALHTGLDFQADIGTPIRAAAGGVVIAQEWHPAFGNLVELDHGNQLVTRYAHASKVRVNKGDLVRRGQHIADVGATGRATGPHLHFEVLVSGVPVDPMRFLALGPTRLEATALAEPAARAPTTRPN
jgi:murein DD-endopeptidase MepM/ murein hydrolase activator NlpD